MGEMSLSEVRAFFYIFISKYDYFVLSTTSKELHGKEVKGQVYNSAKRLRLTTWVIPSESYLTSHERMPLFILQSHSDTSSGRTAPRSSPLLLHL